MYLFAECFYVHKIQIRNLSAHLFFPGELMEIIISRSNTNILEMLVIISEIIAIVVVVAVVYFVK